MVLVSIPAVVGVVLATIASLCFYAAGSDALRISEHHDSVLIASALLMIAALLCEYHA